MSKATHPIEPLLAALADRTLTTAERTQLADLLRDDAHARALYRRYLRIHLLLDLETGGLDTTVPEAIPTTKPSASLKPGDALVPGVQSTIHNPRSAISPSIPFIIYPIAIAAALLFTAAIVGVYLFAFTTDPQPDPIKPNQSGPSVATLIQSTGNLTTPHGYPLEGSDYTAGDYTLDAGSAEFMLTNAVNVRLRGKSQLRMHNDMHVSLTRGSAEFVVPKDAAGFTVHLSERFTVVDLGTAFSVQIGDDERADVRVTDGAVRLDHVLPDGAAMSTLAVAGDLAFVSSDPDGQPVVAFASMDDAYTVGPGADIPDATKQDDPGGDRMNVDRRPVRLPAGTYTVNDWRLAVADHTQGNEGTITPMLLSGTPGAPGSYTTVWVGDAFDPMDDGVRTVAAHGRFTLTQPTDVYAGFFTSNGGGAIIAHSLSGSTDHAAAFNRPSGPDQSVERFSHSGLKRSYAFTIQLVGDANAGAGQHESTTPADRPSANSPIVHASGSETADR